MHSTPPDENTEECNAKAPIMVDGRPLSFAAHACKRPRGHYGPHQCFYCHHEWDREVEKEGEAVSA